MLNMFNMQFRRMFKQKAFRTTSIVVAVLIFLLMFVDKSMGSFIKEPEINVADFIRIFFSEGFLLMILGIFIVLYITYEYNNGFIKNYVGQIKSRAYVVYSEFICIFLYSIIILASIILFSIILAYILFGSNVTIGFDAKFWKLMFYTWIMYLALFYVFAFLATLCRSNAVPIVATVGISNQMFLLFAALINYSADSFFDIDINVGKYLVSNYIYDANVYATASGFVSGTSDMLSGVGFIILCLVYVVLFTFLSAFCMKKRDIV